MSESVIQERCLRDAADALEAGPEGYSQRLAVQWLRARADEVQINTTEGADA